MTRTDRKRRPKIKLFNQNLQVVLHNVKKNQKNKKNRDLD